MCKKFWVELSQKIQLTGDLGNIGAMFNGIKKANGPVQKRPHLNSFTGMIILRQNTVSPEVLDYLKRFQTMDELDSVPIIKESLSNVIDPLAKQHKLITYPLV